MKFLFKIIVCYLFSFNLVYTDSLIFVKNEAQLSFQNSLVGDVDMASNNKKSLFAASLSAIIPGLGQFYLGNKVAGSIYMSVEASLWFTRNYYLDKASSSSESYKQYVRDHWSFPKLIKDYFNPSVLPVTLVINEQDMSYDKAFITQPDDIYNEFLIPHPTITDSLYFFPLWKQGHDAEFDYDGTIVSTGDDATFISIYEDVCNTNESLNYICLLDISSYNNQSEVPEYGTELYDELLFNQINDKINSVVYSHHLYEGVGKYNMFFAGWDDSYLGEITNGPGGYPILNSPNKLFYEYTLRAGHKENNDKAGNLLSLLLVNRAISMFNILLNQSRLSVSSNLNASKYGYNEIKLSIGI
tara:strand:- start:9988 stop:11058 length:1071 start_codon:yes stop_codon:yes gene_type:complete